MSINRLGQKYGRLTVIEQAGYVRNGKGRIATWLCQCDCGKRKIIRGSDLAASKIRSCGCLLAESSRRKGHSCRTHGATRSPEYRSYTAAKSRCENQNSDDFPRYGGRGIRFLYISFEEFFADVGPRPDGMSIERIDNNGHYEPGNCRWATPVEQGNNKRNNRRLSVFGRTQTLAQWAREYGVHKATLRWRLARGVPLDLAVRP